MWKSLIAIVACGIFNSPTSAQTTDTERIDTLLKAMEKRLATADSLRATCTRSDVHPLTKKTVIVAGEIVWRRPNLAKIDLCPPDEARKKDEDKSQLERFIADGKFIWEYSVKDKAIIAHELPKDGATDNVLLMLMRGVKAEDLKKRFDVQLMSDKDSFAVLRLVPKNPADRQDFTALDLAIWIKNPKESTDRMHLPAQIYLFHPNGREISYIFGDVKLNPKLPDATFKAHQIPGYDVKRATSPAMPSPKSPPQPKTP